MALFKKKAPEPTSNHLEVSTVNSPSSYFSIAQHTFKAPGRKENKGKLLEHTEMALFYENKIFVVSYKPMATVPTKEKYIKKLNLKEIADVADSGYSEEVTAIVLKEKGYKELLQTLTDNKVSVVDFCIWVKDELAKLPAKPRGRVASGTKAAKSKTDPMVNTLVQAMRKLESKLTPAELMVKITSLVGDVDRLKAAAGILEAAERANGRDDGGFIRLRIRNLKKK